MKYLTHILLLILLSSCAKQTSPTGGPKDETAPELESSNPKNGSVNFKGSKIELDFSEYIQLDKPKEQIIISPAVKETEITFKKNKVIILLKEKLKDSTTYSLNFRDAVKDLTEKNPAKNLKLAFSTGPYLDSLSISGQAFDLLSSKALKNVTVAVHYVNDTFNIFKHKAELFTIADDKSGAFLIENLKAANFSIYAFQDKNNNLVVDSKNEAYAFISKPLDLKEKSIVKINLPLVALDARPLKVINARPYQNYYTVKLNKFIESYKLDYTNNEKAIHTTGEDLSSVKLYQTFEVPDSTQIRLQVQDSVGNKIDTTLYASFNKEKKEMRLDKFVMLVEKPFLTTKTNELSTLIQFNKPIVNINFDSIYYQTDSTTKYNFSLEEIAYDTVKRTILLTKKIPSASKEESVLKDTAPKSKSEKGVRPVADTPSKKEKIYNELVLGKGAFISVDKDSTANSITKVNGYSEESLGVVLIDKKLLTENTLFQLLDTKGAILKSIPIKDCTGFYELLPGEYRLRIVLDANQNNKWDAGNYIMGEEAERVFYYYDENGNQKFSLKANWEYGPLLITPTFRVENLSTEKKKR